MVIYRITPKRNNNIVNEGMNKVASLNILHNINDAITSILTNLELTSLGSMYFLGIDSSCSS